MKMSHKLPLAVLAGIPIGLAAGQVIHAEQAKVAPAYVIAGVEKDPPIRIPTPGGEVVISTPAEHTAYDDWNYAPARRAGDYVYVSGVVVGRQADGPRTPESFKDATRRAFATLRARLQALGVGFPDVVMINTFHDWSAPEFHGDRMAQFTAFREVKAEFMPAPHPAWTAVGTSGLIREAGIVEVQMIAYAPQRTSATSSATECPTASKVPRETESYAIRRADY